MDPSERPSGFEEVLSRQRFASIVVTHDIEGALPISNHVAMLDRGRIRFVGTPQEFRESTDTLVRAFLERDAMTGSSKTLEMV